MSPVHAGTFFNHYGTRSKNDLSKQLSELKNELLTLRVQKIAGGSASKLTRM
jgi:large subunit ribosomal protein L35e